MNVKKIIIVTLVFIIAGTTIGKWLANYYAIDVLANNGSCGAVPVMVKVPGGNFSMGFGAQYREEGPVRMTQVDDFFISKYEVTNNEFAEFVSATGYVTVAEQSPDPLLYPDIPSELLVPGSAVFVKLTEAVDTGSFLNWWQFKPGAHWRQPMGEGSSIADKGDYPVIHIALADALAYARWKGHRLPTEAEYEYASRGGIDGARYAYGNSLLVDGKYQANTWQGTFPIIDSAEDGYVGLAPVGCYDGNPYGVHDLIGNVWEWTSSPYYPRLLTPEEAENLDSDGFDPNQPGISVSVVKGGSYLCAEDFCARYRPAARHAQDTGLGTSHIGFRTVKDINKELNNES